jgi:hypothetical protein
MVSYAREKFDANGRLEDEKTRRLIAELVESLIALTARMGKQWTTRARLEPIEFRGVSSGYLQRKRPLDLKVILDFLKDDYVIRLEEDPRIQVDESILKQINDIATKKSITQKEAFEQLIKDYWHTFRKGAARLKKIFRKHGAPITRKDYEKQKQESQTTKPRR